MALLGLRLNRCSSPMAPSAWAEERAASQAADAEAPKERDASQAADAEAAGGLREHTLLNPGAGRNEKRRR